MLRSKEDLRVHKVMISTMTKSLIFTSLTMRKLTRIRSINRSSAESFSNKTLLSMPIKIRKNSRKGIENKEEEKEDSEETLM
jgi:hypothetical protein